MKGRVLVVDDDDDLRDIVTEVLRDHGYEVGEAIDGSAAMERLRAGFDPGVVLLDLMMPVMTGWEVLAECSRDPRLAHLPIVVMTARAGLSQPGKPPLGSDIAVLSKPFTTEQLLKIVEAHCTSAP